MELRGARRGVVVVDDFAHHPTAVRETLAAAALRWEGRRLWAVFEPRSFTARSKVFQDEFPAAFESADRVIVAAVFSSSRLPSSEELSEEELVAELRRRGVESWFIPSVDEIVRFLADRVIEGDVVLAMSNGGFGGLHRKLLEALQE
jgi:UDP-N-acetylmuramate: L-alanyl-gamma-D-glutamyl-meso-diaminopimelate ligase